jgi:Pyruvate/2-oxoacid:ferredoxin oxidoreductase delta subunit
MQKLKRKYQNKRIKLLRKKNKLAEFALRDASWTVANTLGTFAGFSQGNSGLYSWKQLASPDENLDKKEEQKIQAQQLEKISEKVKSAAKFFGASIVGITRLNPLWIYSHSYNRSNEQNQTLNLPKSYKFAVIMGIEMDHNKINSLPLDASTATGLGYSKMSFVTSLLAQFIRNLGYKALPCGNDTALSIPIAIDAGLGELGRNGLLITPQFGPRIRLCKVITDLPLKPDPPIDFGLREYCKTCNECFKKCPAKAISKNKTTKSTTISNSPGIMKYSVNGEKCYEHWSKQGIDCSICIKVCPYNKI